MWQFPDVDIEGSCTASVSSALERSASGVEATDNAVPEAGFDSAMAVKLDEQTIGGLVLEAARWW